MDTAPLAHSMHARRRIAVAGALTGVVALLNGGASRVSGKNKKNKKNKRKQRDRCPACPVCPAPETCPARTCCQCALPSPIPGCHLIGASASMAAGVAACLQHCGGMGTVTNVIVPNPGESAVCSNFNSCSGATCPL